MSKEEKSLVKKPSPLEFIFKIAFSPGPIFYKIFCFEAVFVVDVSTVKYNIIVVVAHFQSKRSSHHKIYVHKSQMVPV